MESVFAYVLQALPAQSADPAYDQQVATAMAAFATLVAMMIVIYLVVRATFLILRAFTSYALTFTLALVVIFTAIGVSNR